MVTKYPQQVDNSSTLPTFVGTTGFSPSSINILRDAILAIENAVGPLPAGIYGTVRNRLDAIQTTVNTLVAGGGVVVAGDIGGTALAPVIVGLRGQAIKAQTLTSGQDGYTLTWVNSDGQWEAKPAPAPETFATAGATIGANKAVFMVAGKVQPHTGSTTIPVFGFTLSGLANGATGPITIYGPIAGFGLGDGYACAVGVSAAGVPVRATDATCVSAPNWLGYCDAKGNVFVEPRRADNFNVLDYGAVGDGITDNTNVIQICLNLVTKFYITNALSQVVGGMEIFFPVGIYVVSASLNLPHGSIGSNVILRGVSDHGSVIQANGYFSVIQNLWPHNQTISSYIKIHDLTIVGPGIAPVVTRNTMYTLGAIRSSGMSNRLLKCTGTGTTDGYIPFGQLWSGVISDPRIYITGTPAAAYDSIIIEIVSSGTQFEWSKDGWVTINGPTNIAPTVTLVDSITGATGLTANFSGSYVNFRFYCSPPQGFGFSTIIDDVITDGTCQWTVIDGGCGYLDLNGGQVTLSNVTFMGLTMAAIFDGTEISASDHLSISGCANGIWLTGANQRLNGFSDTDNSLGQSNVHAFRNIWFSCSQINIANEQNANIQFDTINFEGGHWLGWVTASEFFSAHNGESEGSQNGWYLGSTSPFSGSASFPNTFIKFSHQLIDPNVGHGPCIQLSITSPSAGFQVLGSPMSYLELEHCSFLSSTLHNIVGGVQTSGLRVRDCEFNNVNWLDSTPTNLTVEDARVGLGIGCIPSEQLDVSGTSIRIRTANTPSSASDSQGNVGDIGWDANYVYVKTGTTNWMRSPLSVFSNVQDGYVLAWDNADGYWKAKPAPGPETFATAGATIGANKVVFLINGKVQQHTGSNSVPIYGFTASGLANGATGPITIYGQLAGFSLGDGYACAVGVNSSGTPVRATDVTCVSSPNYLGYCDGYGTITVAPKQTTVLVATDFGLIGDGITLNDDVNTLMINSIACQLGKSIFYPGGNYVFAKTIGPYPLGCTVSGAGISGRATGLSSSIGTTFLFSGQGVGLQAGGHAPQANVSNGATFQDLEILGINPNGDGSYPNINEIGIEIQTDTEVKLKNIRLGGFKYQLSFDGCETCVADGIYFEGIPPSNLGYPAATMITDSGVNSAFAARFGAFNSQVGASACNGNTLNNVQLNNTYWGFFHQGGIGNIVSNVNSEIKGMAIFGGDGYSAATISNTYQNIIGEGTLTGFRILISTYTPNFVNIRLGQDAVFLDIHSPVVNLNMTNVYLINTTVAFPVVGSGHIVGGACIGCAPPDGDGYSTLNTIFDVDPGMLVDNGAGSLGIYGQPLSPLDVNGNRLRIRTSHTPSSTSDSFGNIGDISWDANYIYSKTGVGNWKRAPLTVFSSLQDGYVLTWDGVDGYWKALPNDPLTVNVRTIVDNYTIDGYGRDDTLICDTTTRSFTLTLPTPLAGRAFNIIDKTNNFGTNNVIVARHGSEKINNAASDLTLSTNGQRIGIESDGTDWYSSS